MHYKSFYNMQTEAFGSLPVRKLFYSSSTHRDCWKFLVRGAVDLEPFLLVTGDYGLGKTMLSMMLARLLAKRRMAFVQITDPHSGFPGILRRIAASLAINTDNREEHDLLEEIYARLNDQNGMKSLTLIIDDAQELAIQALMRLRALANFHRDGFFPIQLFLFAHLSFTELLGDPQLRALDQRIKRRQQLRPLTFQETREYIYFRLFKSGAPGTPTFSEGACREIFALSGGIPRLINNISDASLSRGALKMETCLSRETVRAAHSPSRPPSMADTAWGGHPALTDATEDTKRPHLSPAAQGTTKQLHQPLKETGILPTSDPPAGRRLRMRPLALALLSAIICLTGWFLLDDFSPKQKEAMAPPAERTLTPPTPLASHLTTPAADSTLEKSIATAIAPPEPAAEPEEHVVAEEIAVIEADSNQQIVVPSTEPLDLPRTHPGTAPPQRPYTVKLASYKNQSSDIWTFALFKKKNLAPFAANITLPSPSGEHSDRWSIFYSGSFSTRQEAADALRAIDIPDGQVIAMPFACRVGIFRENAGIDEARSRLEQLGYAHYFLKNEDGTVSLFTGLFNRRVNAETLRQELAGKNMECTVALLRQDLQPSWDPGVEDEGGTRLP